MRLDVNDFRRRCSFTVDMRSTRLRLRLLCRLLDLAARLLGFGGVKFRKAMNPVECTLGELIANDNRHAPTDPPRERRAGFNPPPPGNVRDFRFVCPTCGKPAPTGTPLRWEGDKIL